MATALFITTKDIQAFTAMNGSVDPDNFIQFVKQAQELDVLNYLGTDLYNKINSDIINDDLQTPYLELVTTYIKPMVIHWAMTYYLPFAAYTIGNRGISKHTTENGEGVTKTEVDYLVKKEESVAMAYTQKFIKHICNNVSLYPEYSSNTVEDTTPSRRNSNYGGWQL